MRYLSGLDASFLFLENERMPMHVGALHVFELPADYAGDFVADLRAHVARRLPALGPLRRRLAEMPLKLTVPAWEDAAPDLAQHVVGITLPPGSGLAALEAEVGRLHPILLPRDRPLWKFHVFDGLVPGADGTQRRALYTQLHHAAVDGQAAVALAQALLDLGPVPRELEARAPRPPRAPYGTADLLRGAFAHQLGRVGALAKALPAAVSALGEVAARTAGGAVERTLQRNGRSVSNLGLAPRTRLNVTVSPTRAFAAQRLSLAELNVVRRRHGASLNDAVMMVCSGALRRFFLRHGGLSRKPMVAAVPISLRAAGDTAANNQASMSLISLGTHIADPARRLAHVRAAGAAMKDTVGRMKSVLPTDFPSLGVPWLVQGLTSLYGGAQVAERLPPMANVVISNVPGPTVPLYMAGARMLTNFPTSIVVHGVALNITVQTYDQWLDLGLIACGAAMPEVGELKDDLLAAFAEFAALPAPAAASAAAPTAARPGTAPATGRERPPRATAPVARRASG